MSNSRDGGKDEEKSKGAALVRAFAQTLPDSPGVYRMLDGAGNVLYVGKAKSLKKRVLSYTRTARLPPRLRRMVDETGHMEFVGTHTETEALLLESNLIKKLAPRYNILLRDDKSFPYILITGDHDFPLLTRHRGTRARKGEYFGPFADGGAVARTIATLQKLFRLRNCPDTVFAGRTRPCLQYHIKRCTAPCVKYVDKESYAAQVADARAFLSGESRAVQDRLARQMQEASAGRRYEEAATFRDRLRALAAVQEKQDINTGLPHDTDVVALHREGARSCVQVFFFRGGQNFGNRAYFPRHGTEESDGEILAAFIAQFYENKQPPAEIVASHEIDGRALLEQALGARRIVCAPGRGARRRVAEFAARNAKDALARERARLAGDEDALAAIADLFGLDAPPRRIEVYDNSHSAGTNMTGAMIVAGPEGFRKPAYRKFNIRHADAADDYAMMREVVARRFAKAAEEGNGPGSENWPDLILIDGGKGQLRAVMDVLEEAGIENDLTAAAVAKGPDRNAGRETFFLPGRAPFSLPPGDPVLHYLQRLRDEAHRFAIGAHRARRAKQAGESPLDGIPGIGAKRKKALLLHFGSGTAAARAGLADLQAVPGISKAVAEKIYRHFHE